MNWGVPSPPVGRNPVVDRRFDQILARLDTVDVDIKTLHSVAIENSERELRSIRNLYSSPESYLPALKRRHDELAADIASLRAEIMKALSVQSELVLSQNTITRVLLEGFIKENIALLQEDSWRAFWRGGLRWWNDLRHRAWLILNRPLRF